MKNLPVAYNTKQLEAKIKNKWRWEWLSESDSRGEKWGDWLQKPEASGMAFCQYCNKTINYKSNGKKSIRLHAEDAAHLQNKKIVKTNQENGHMKANGDASPAAAEKEEIQTNGSAAAEEGQASAEQHAPAEEVAANAEEGATPSTSNDTPKKKRFSFKKSFKLSGFSFKKTKKETRDGGEEVVAGSEGAEAVEGVLEDCLKPAEEAALAGETKPEEKPLEEPKAAGPSADEPKEEEVPEPTISPSPALPEESSPEVQADSATE